MLICAGWTLMVHYDFPQWLRRQAQSVAGSLDVVVPDNETLAGECLYAAYLVVPDNETLAGECLYAAYPFEVLAVPKIVSQDRAESIFFIGAKVLCGWSLCAFMVVACPVGGPDTWTLPRWLLNVSLSVIQLRLGVALHGIMRATTPSHVISWALPVLMSVPGFIVALLGATRHISPSAALRFRLNASLAIGLACSVWFHYQSGSATIGYQRMPHTEKLAIFFGLRVLDGLLGPTGRLRHLRRNACSEVSEGCSIGGASSSV